MSTTAVVITDRSSIAEVIAAGLEDLDRLRARKADADNAVTAAQAAAADAAEGYAIKIDEVLATGWATPEGLAAQGHHAPKKRSKTRPAATTDGAGD